MEEVKQAGGRQCDKREGGGHETSGWQTMQGNQVANNMTREGGQRTLHKAIGRLTTQQVAGVDNMGQLDEVGVDNAGQSDNGQHKEKRGVEDLTWWQTIR